MQAVIQKLNAQGQVETSIQRLPSGVVGTQQTLALMHQSIVAALTNELLLTAALAAANIADRAASARAEVERVQRWVQQNIAYVLDPVSIELLQAPAITLQRRRGDCDDQTSLLCALLTALGYQCRMVAIGFAPGAYAHVYTEVNLDGQWLAAETIRPWALGREPEGVKASMRMVVNVPAETLAGLNGLWSSITKPFKNIVTQVGRTVRGTLKSVTADPLGTVMNVGRAVAGDPSGLLMQTVGASATENQRIALAKQDAAAQADYEKAVAAQQAQIQAQLAQQQAAAASPIAAGSVQAVVPAQDQVMAFVKANPVPVGIGAALLLALLVID